MGGECPFPRDVLVDLVDNHFLAWAPRRDADHHPRPGIMRSLDDVTFGTPLQYIYLSKLFPKVFLSHANGDYDRIKPLQLLLEQAEANVVTCEMPDAMVSMEKGLSGWMRRQTTLNDEVNEFAVLVLSENFVSRLMNKQPGVFREVSNVVAELKAHPHLRHRVKLAYLGDYDTSWAQNVEHIKWLLNGGDRLFSSLAPPHTARFLMRWLLWLPFSAALGRSSQR